jgi:hypothetical protein
VRLNVTRFGAAEVVIERWAAHAHLEGEAERDKGFGRQSAERLIGSRGRDD